MDPKTKDELNAILSALCIKVQGFELTHLIGAPADRQWVVRGCVDDNDNKTDVGKQAEYFGPSAAEAILAAKTANP